MEKAAQGYVQALRAVYPALADAPDPVFPPALFAPPVVSPPEAASQPAAAAPPTPGAVRWSPGEDKVLDMLADAAADLRIADQPGGLDDAARAWAELRRRP